MACCDVQLSRGGAPAARGWRGIGSSVGSGALLLLLPKCPACIAAYLALWTGLGIAAPVAGHLRVVVGAIFILSLAWLLLRRVFAGHSRAA